MTTDLLDPLSREPFIEHLILPYKGVCGGICYQSKQTRFLLSTAASVYKYCTSVPLQDLSKQQPVVFCALRERRGKERVE